MFMDSINIHEFEKKVPTRIQKNVHGVCTSMFIDLKKVFTRSEEMHIRAFENIFTGSNNY
jgi:hypothetical protein